MIRCTYRHTSFEPLLEEGHTLVGRKHRCVPMSSIFVCHHRVYLVEPTICSRPPRRVLVLVCQLRHFQTKLLVNCKITSKLQTFSFEGDAGVCDIGVFCVCDFFGVFEGAFLGCLTGEGSSDLIEGSLLTAGRSPFVDCSLLLLSASFWFLSR